MTESNERRSVGAMELLIICGFSAYFTWYLMFLIGLPGYFPSDVSFDMRRIIQLFGFAGLIAGSVGALRRPSNFDSKAYSPIKTFVWTIVGVLIPLFVMIGSVGVQTPWPIIAFLFFVTGVGAGFFYTGWENLSARGRMRDDLLSTGIVMILSCALFLMVSVFMQPLAQGVMGIFLVITNALIFYGVSLKRFPKERQRGQKDDQEEDGESHHRVFSMRMSVLLLVANLSFGFGLPLLYTISPLYFFSAFAAASVVLVVFLVLLRLGVFGREITFTTLLRWAIGSGVVALLMIGISVKLYPFALFILFATWLLCLLIHGGTLLQLTRIHKVDPVFLIVRGKLPGNIGFLIGCIIGTVFIIEGADSAALPIISLVLVAVLVVTLLILLPVSQNYSRQLQLARSKGHYADDQAGGPAEATDRFRCAELAKRFNLSPREEEILFYIVKGRNAKYIADRLIISESTAKTHIHNIYKKSGIHSQQRFIDLMDEII